MTLPDERTRTLQLVKKFLYRLMDAKQTPKVPPAIREEAMSLLKHYPEDFVLDQLGSKMPDYFE